MDHVENWRQERQSSWIYQRVAAQETDRDKRELFEELARAADDQAKIWASKVDGDLPDFHPDVRARVVAWTLRVFGPRAMRPVLAAVKVRGLSVYNGRILAPGHPLPTQAEQIGRRHRGSGGNLRAAVFGVNDGLVSNTSLILGVAGARNDPATILTAGVAGLLAGALSMAAGEYVSVRSQREMFEYQIGLEADELEAYPEAEAEELALIYQARGMELEAARTAARQLIQNPQHALDTLAREELGLNPEELGSPWGAAGASFLAFAVGAIIPVIPSLLVSGPRALWITIAVAASSLFAVGATLSLFTGRRALWGGLRMVLIGSGAGMLTWLIGRLVGISLD